MLDDNAYGLSRRRVTLSTSGLVPAIDRLREECPVALAVSLHAPNDALRDQLVPINRKYPIAELLAACLRYIERAPRDFVTFEYVMLDHVNDGAEHARELIALVRDVPCKFNLIPFNPFPNTEFRTSSRTRILAFQKILTDAGLVTTDPQDARRRHRRRVRATRRRSAGSHRRHSSRIPPVLAPLQRVDASRQREMTRFSPRFMVLAALAAVLAACASKQPATPAQPEPPPPPQPCRRVRSIAPSCTPISAAAITSAARWTSRSMNSMKH